MITSYNELTVGKYQEIRKIDFDDLDILEQQVALIAVLNDMDEEEVFDLPLEEYKELSAGLQFLNTPPQIDYKRKLKSITLKGQEYRILQDAREMSCGQYIDYQHYLGADNFDEQLPNILTVFVLPKDKEYGEDYDIYELAQTFRKDMPIITAMEIAAFFFRVSQFSIKTSLRSLRMRLRMMMRRTKDETVKEQMREAISQLELLSNSTDSLGGLILPSK